MGLLRNSRTPAQAFCTLSGLLSWLPLSVGRHSDGSPWKKSEQGRPMAEAVARAKITPALSFHALLHTWASLSIMAGMPMMVAARNLGTATPA